MTKDWSGNGKASGAIADFGKRVELDGRALDRLAATASKTGLMMGGVSDMVLARNELSRKLRDGLVDGGIEAAFERLSLCVAEMRDAITRTRMQRIDHSFRLRPGELNQTELRPERLFS